MATINQALRLTRISKKKKNKVAALQQNPQKKGICLKVFTMTPKKPNSALRKVVRIVAGRRGRLVPVHRDGWIT